MSVDKNHEPGSFWLIDSQIFKLMRGVQESLAERVAVLSLTSMSQAEIARDADINLDTGKGLA